VRETTANRKKGKLRYRNIITHYAALTTIITPLFLKIGAHCVAPRKTRVPRVFRREAQWITGCMRVHQAITKNMANRKNCMTTTVTSNDAKFTTSFATATLVVS
jgi:hypothetical protein